MFWLRKSKGKGQCLRLYCLAGNLWVYLILKLNGFSGYSRFVHLDPFN